MKLQVFLSFEAFRFTFQFFQCILVIHFNSSDFAEIHLEVFSWMSKLAAWVKDNSSTMDATISISANLCNYHMSIDGGGQFNHAVTEEKHHLTPVSSKRSSQRNRSLRASCSIDNSSVQPSRHQHSPLPPLPTTAIGGGGECGGQSKSESRSSKRRTHDIGQQSLPDPIGLAKRWVLTCW